jgi:FkbH-like protein
MHSPDAALVRAMWQPVLFGAPNRANLAHCVPAWELRSLRIRVHRNHGFEAVSSASAPFAAWNGLALEWTIGAYDDSLSFELDTPADVEVVWLDTRRIRIREHEGIARWLLGRLIELRARCTSPIVLLAWPLAESERATLAGAGMPGMFVADLSTIEAVLGEQWLDLRTAAISGTDLGNHACIRVARELACRWLPSVALPPCKAIVVDLDDTLYRGVLAEDGANNVELTRGHRELQERLHDFRNAGTLLALVSRNERPDVDALFARRTDFPLRLDDFSAVEVSWEDKAAALRRVAEILRIAPDAMVFIDDNAGELANVVSSLPVFTVHARPDGADTAAALDYVAGLFRWQRTKEDSLRADDLVASVARSAMSVGTRSADEYLRSLHVELEFLIGPRQHVARLAELASKTNQFNLSLRRMNEAEIARKLDDRPSNVVAIRLGDRLSNSGIVGLVVGSRIDETLHVDELCLSCRALGRRLEDSMLTKALMLMAGEPAPDRVVFALCKGPRNEPARGWLQHYSQSSIRDDSPRLEMPFAVIAGKAISPAIHTKIVP